MWRVFLRVNAKPEAGQYWPGPFGRLAKDGDVGIVLEALFPSCAWPRHVSYE